MKNIRQVIKQILNEKLELKDWKEYSKLVTQAYIDAPKFDSTVVNHWNDLNKHNYVMWKRLLSKVDITFVSEFPLKSDNINILGKDYKLINSGNPYEKHTEMINDYKQNNMLFISIDYSNHPVFSVKDNIVFRTVHDFIVHVLGNHPFGLRGEIASYNRHAKLLPVNARPAAFTEIVGQACYAVNKGNFPTQKIAVLNGFDFLNVGVVDGYKIDNKELIKDI